MEFQLLTTEGGITYPRDFQKNWTLLFYYAGDFLPVSATELLGLAALEEAFRAQNCGLLCVSTDSIPVHLAFLETLGRYRWPERPLPIRFPLAADPEGALRRQMELQPGKKYLWLLAPGGEPKAHFSYPDVIGANFTEALRTLAALQTERPTPYGWTPGAHTLALPPATRAESRSHMREQERAGNYCIDWYLCFETSEP